MDKNYRLIINHLKISTEKINLDLTKESNNITIPNGAYFDIDYYKKTYLNEDVDPISHYLDIGYKKGYDPNPDFDGDFYLENNPDIKEAGYNPFIHFLKRGLYEGRLPKLLTFEEALNQNLKKTIKGKNNYLFLFNDSSNELRQHFDKSYKSPFNLDTFLKVQNLKRKLCESKNINFYSFYVPDKSVICKDFLPFEIDYIKRVIEDVEEIVDLKSDYLKPLHYFKYDTHINYEGGKLLSFKILNYLDNSFNLNEYNKLLNDSKEIFIERIYDLFFESNWSYSAAEFYFHELKGDIKGSEKTIQPKFLEDLESEIPKKYLFSKERKSILYKNNNSYTDLRVLVFGDSNMTLLRNYLSFYFNEMFIYWDHGTFDKEVIEWFKPDLILEIRAERFLEKLPIPSWIDIEVLNNNTTQKQEIKKLKEENKQLKNKNKKLEKTLKEILSSKSWKLTKPLRNAKNKLTNSGKNKVKE